MRIGSVQPGRPEYYDRNPTQVAKLYNVAAVGPHLTTERWRYTVPSDRKAYIQNGFNRVFRSIAAAPVGQVVAFIQFHSTLGEDAFLSELGSVDNTLYVERTAYLPPTGLMSAGDFAAAFTVDTGTGGGIDYTISLWAVQFDA